MTHYDGAGVSWELSDSHLLWSAVSGVRRVAPNGFMNGTTGEDGTMEDSYPADGPLQSGTMSLRRVKPKSKVKALEFGRQGSVWQSVQLVRKFSSRAV